MNSRFSKMLMLSLALTPFLLGEAVNEETMQQESQSTDQNKESGRAVGKKSEGADSVQLMKKIMEVVKMGVVPGVSESDVIKFFSTTLQKVLENNKDLRQKREEVLAALGTNAMARAEFLPDINVFAGYNFSENFNTTSDHDLDGKSKMGKKEKDNGSGVTAGIELKQNLFNGGRSIATYKAAINENKSKYEDYKALEGDVVQKVFKELMEIITQRILLQANEANVAMHKELLKAAIEKMKVGDVDRSEVAYAESKCAASEAKLNAIRIKLDSGLSNFELWTGIHPKDILLLHPNFSKFLPKTLEEMKRMAGKNSHRILSGHYLALAKKAAIKKAEAGFSPSFDLTLNGGLDDGLQRRYNHADYDYKKLAENDHSKMNYSIGVRLSLPLDVKGVTRTAIGGARHDYVKTQIGGAQAYDSVMSDVETDFYQLKHENAIVESYKRQVKACEIALQGVLQELAVGAKVYVQTLKAQSDLLDARGDLAEAYKARANTELRLLKSIGRLNNGTFGGQGFLFDPMNMQVKQSNPTPSKQKEIKEEVKKSSKFDMKKVNSAVSATVMQKAIQNAGTTASVVKKAAAVA